MRMTESRLRSVIRSVIKETYNFADDPIDAHRNDYTPGRPWHIAKTLEKCFSEIEGHVELVILGEKQWDLPHIQVIDGDKTYKLDEADQKVVYDELNLEGTKPVGARASSFFDFMQRLGLAN